jgi:inosine-uridine nucleoside N-ribohydrolase/formylmethanofuran dehydrogenase subunit E
MKKILLLASLAFLLFSLSAHPWKPRHYVIVDTDCGLDDYRALCMLLASTDVRVLAITTSNGVLDAETGYHKVKSLLNDLHHEGILVGMHADSKVKVESCLPALQMEWGIPPASLPDPPKTDDIVNAVLENTRESITFISLGSLNPVGFCLEECPAFSQKVTRIIWSSLTDYKTGNFNYDLDKKAADRVISGSIPLCLVNSGTFTHYDDLLINSFDGFHSSCAAKIRNSLLNNASGTPFAGSVFDEAVALYLHYPQCFQADTAGNIIRYQLSFSEGRLDPKTAYYKILSGETSNQNQVFSGFPMDTSFYFSDIQHGMMFSIAKYGREEWIANVLANELHRHLGVYAVIGVKMGVRAKEYFGAGIDEMEIVSYAGLTPPFSCLNDGLQVSTGATLGHGLIQVMSDSIKLPEADFTYMNRTIRLSLKPEFRSRVEKEIRELARIYGLDSNIYWELVRNAAIRYWNTLDRQIVFSVQEL